MAEVLKETLLQFLCCHQDSTCKKYLNRAFYHVEQDTLFTLVERKGRKHKLLHYTNELQVKLNQKNLHSALNTNDLNRKNGISTRNRPLHLFR